MSKHILNALPDLIKAGILPEDTAARIREYYRQQETAAPQRMPVVFGIIGSILVGLGIILILAHNWDDLGRPLKVILSFLPLITGQICCGYTLIKRPENIAWRESSTVFLFFAVGAVIALISQVYNIHGDLAGFILSWMLLCIPLVYIMRSSIASLLFIAGITVYAVNDGYGYQAADAHLYWGLILLVIPHYIQLIHVKPASNFTFFHHWAFPLSLTICLGSIASGAGEYLYVAYMSMFGAFYLLGTSRLISFSRIITNGYLIIGSLGSMGIMLTLSFRWFWEGFDDYKDAVPTATVLAMILTTLCAILLLYKNLKDSKDKDFNLIGFVFAAFACVFFIGKNAPTLGMVLMNILVLSAAILTIRRGLVLNHLGILNYGLLIIAILALCRFFDTDISFIFRGLMFVAVGAGFFMANTRLLKNRKDHA